jgi:hypothetical protein
MITLRTIEQYTPLEIIDYVTPLMLAQNARSWDADQDQCSYRGDGGLKCAIGHIMSDEEWNELDLYERYAGVTIIGELFDVPVLYWSMLQKLQTIHDTVEPDEWEYSLADLRRSYV